MNRVHLSHDDLPKTFEELCALHLPRTIRDKVDYENTAEILTASLYRIGAPKGRKNILKR
jgi:hypothetical protein